MPLKTVLTTTRDEMECILDALKGTLSKSQFKTRDHLIRNIDYSLHGSREVVKPNGYAPMGRIKPSWPSNFTRPTRIRSPRKPRDKKAKVTKSKAVQTAQEILAEL